MIQNIYGISFFCAFNGAPCFCSTDIEKGIPRVISIRGRFEMEEWEAPKLRANGNSSIIKPQSVDPETGRFFQPRLPSFVVSVFPQCI